MIIRKYVYTYMPINTYGVLTTQTQQGRNIEYFSELILRGWPIIKHATLVVGQK